MVVHGGDGLAVGAAFVGAGAGVVVGGTLLEEPSMEIAASAALAGSHSCPFVPFVLMASASSRRRGRIG